MHCCSSTTSLPSRSALAAASLVASRHVVEMQICVLHQCSAPPTPHAALSTCPCPARRRFMGAPADSIPRGNVEEFVAYGFHCRLLGQLDNKERAQIRQFVDEVRAVAGRRAPRRGRAIFGGLETSSQLPPLYARASHTVSNSSATGAAHQLEPVPACCPCYWGQHLLPEAAIPLAPVLGRWSRPGACASSPGLTPSCPSWRMCGSR